MNRLTAAAFMMAFVSANSKTADMNDLPFVIDESNFYELVLTAETNEIIGEKPWFIEFYAPWCPHCQHLAPVWDQFHREEKETLNVGRCDCTSDAGSPLCDMFNVTGYPTLLYFPVGEETGYHKYHGERTVKGFKSWVEGEKWRETDNLAIGTNKSFLEQVLPQAGLILDSLKSNFLS